MHLVNNHVDEILFETINDSRVSADQHAAFELHHRAMHASLDPAIDHVGILFSLLDAPRN